MSGEIIEGAAGFDLCDMCGKLKVADRPYLCMFCERQMLSTTQAMAIAGLIAAIWAWKAWEPEGARAALLASRAEARKLWKAVVPLRSIARMTLPEGPSPALANSIRKALAETAWIDGKEGED